MRYEAIFDTSVITLAGPIDEMMIQVFDRTLKDIHANPTIDDRAIVLLTTYGGASGYAAAMYERLRLAQRSFDLTIVGVGLVYSHGATLLTALPKDKRFLTAGTRVHLHELQKEHRLELTGPQSARRILLEQELQTIEEEAVTLDWTVRALAYGTGRDVEEVRATVRGGRWFSAQEAVDWGLAGALVEER